ncbi:urease [Trichonephila clavipes]|nr:urease [Trichonephila clavipes]
MPDMKIEDNGLFEVERKLNVYLNSNKLEQLENQHAKKLIMKLTPREIDSLLIHQAGYLAQKRLARGCKLNHPEAVALIACQIQEFARNGDTVAQLMNKGQLLLAKMLQTSRRGRGQQDDSKYIGNAGSEMLF